MAAVTADTDALGEVSVLVEHDGRLVSGQSVSTDTLEASARAYLRALSNALAGVGARRSRCRPRRKPEHGLSRAATSPGVDGERLIRFGDGALDEAPALLAGRGFEGYALLTTARGAQRGAGAGRGRRRRRCDVPAGRRAGGGGRGAGAAWTAGRSWRSAAAG